MSHILLWKEKSKRYVIYTPPLPPYLLDGSLDFTWAHRNMEDILAQRADVLHRQPALCWHTQSIMHGSEVHLSRHHQMRKLQGCITQRVMDKNQFWQIIWNCSFRHFLWLYPIDRERELKDIPQRQLGSVVTENMNWQWQQSDCGRRSGLEYTQSEGCQLSPGEGLGCSLYKEQDTQFLQFNKWLKQMQFSSAKR